MSKPIKNMVTESYKRRFADLDGGVIVDLCGVASNDNNLLRNTLAQQGIRITIIKNSLARTAFIGTPLEGPAEISDLSQLLGSFVCAALPASATPNAPMVIEGYVASSEDLARLGDGLAALGLLGGHVNRAEVAGAPFCGALETLHSQTEVGSALRGAPLVRPYQHGLDYLQGENLVLAATATSRFDGYLYVDLVLPDGRVRHLQPRAGGSPATVPAGQELVLGDGEGGQVIEAPFGRQLAIVLSTPRPLFEAPRPEIEEAEPYFAALRAALEALSREAPSAVVLSGYSFLSTRSAD